MPWRTDHSPYFVLISEIMLQQTQVSRVIPKFEAFVQRFPDIATLAQATLGEVLQLWSGLGYNRRAKFLWQAAQALERDYAGVIPSTLTELVKLPGVGKNTAGAVMVYAHNEPVVFIETNIRTVYFHHFFEDSDAPVSDMELRELVEMTIDTEHPRQWYWALMDYGSFLKKTAGGRLTQSRQYKKQSPLAGSLREMRGKILKVLSLGEQSETTLFAAVEGDDRFTPALDALQKEGMIQQIDEGWRLTADSHTR
jgi:A/G-specific adenine glycosylase